MIRLGIEFSSLLSNSFIHLICTRTEDTEVNKVDRLFLKELLVLGRVENVNNYLHIIIFQKVLD